MENEQIAEWLYDGAVALCEGDKARAVELLMRVVQADENNAEAWLWLSGAVDDIEDQMIALENVMALDPGNEYARQGLEWLSA
ncbi:MAG: hypothetical protein MI924_01905 [Chloroflexales bacterium]|nr:hypothetical protein [Chloroflexales bacterium]